MPQRTVWRVIIDSNLVELHQQNNTIDPHGRPLPMDRRTFLKVAGFTFAGGMVIGCERARVEKAIPFLVKPEEITPGVATWYATSCSGCSAGCGVLAKNRDGRPIKLEGNPDHPLNNGGLCAVGQASLLPLYDSQRLDQPLKNGQKVSWDEVDAAIQAQLGEIDKAGKAVRVLTDTVTSPTTAETINRFLKRFKDARHVVYDTLSASAILDAHEQTHGVRALPRYHFEHAEVIASFDADFLGTWISPVEFTAGYRAGRTLEGTPPKMSYHIQFESRMSLTGTNADERVSISPNDLPDLLAYLANLLAAKAGAPAVRATEPLSASHEKVITTLASRLWKARGRGLVICGENDVTLQLITNYINHLLGNEGKTIDIERPSYQKQGSDKELYRLLDEIRSGEVAALFIRGVNPVYDLPHGAELANELRKVPLVVSFSDREDETAAAARYVCPEPHPLETWSDMEPVAGVAAVAQPLLRPFGNTRPFVESLALWSGRTVSAYDLIREEWERSIFKRQSGETVFQSFWDKTVHDGFALISPQRVRARAFDVAAIRNLRVPRRDSKTLEHTLVLYPKVALLDGRHAHNPWLQELPDPVTKIVWDNYAALSPAAARSLNVVDGDVVRVVVDGKHVELPVHIQAGQHDGVVAIAMGYGRKGTDRFTNIGPRWIGARPTVPPNELVGKNAAPFLRFEDSQLKYSGVPVRIEKTGRRHQLACTQEHHSLQVPEHLAPKGAPPRPIIQNATLAAYALDPSAGSFPKAHVVSLWPEEHTYPGHHWGMAIDLTACTGCSACVVSCQAENNIPAVGKDEVGRKREMTWIRIDRYYEEWEDGSVTAAHQPMLCQHCDNAPCETVCPVLATVHSEEGLNQQIYNRCVGTRYCSNNCPYKVRRFNWFDYPHGDERHKLLLNPDVTVRERGVMEKCSFCVQRIQEARIEAKKEGRKIRDGDIQPACQQSCPAKAIVFGDMNDPQSEVAKRMSDPRFYRVLEEVGIKPSIGYMTRVRDRAEGGSAHG